MFRARKPSVQRASAGKYPPAELPPIKREPRAVVDDAKSEVLSAPRVEHINPTVPSNTVSEINRTKISPLHPQLPPLQLPESNEPHITANLSPAPQRVLYDTEADMRYWQKKNEYQPSHADDDDDDDDDLVREVRKDRKIAPENDPLFAQIFAMFPEEEPAQ